MEGKSRSHLDCGGGKRRGPGQYSRHREQAAFADRKAW